MHYEVYVQIFSRLDGQLHEVNKPDIVNFLE